MSVKTVTIMQGDSYPIPIEVTQGDVTVAPELIEEIEVMIGSIRKTGTSGGVIYHEGWWYVQPTQEETFMMEGQQAVYVRLKYEGQPPDVIGRQVGILNVLPTGSKVVL